MKMTLRQLARKVKCEHSTLSGLEKRELSGDVTVRKLREVAEKMGFTLNLHYEISSADIENALLKQAKKQLYKEQNIKESDATERQIKEELSFILKNNYINWDIDDKK